MRDKHIVLFVRRSNEFGDFIERIETPNAKLTGRVGRRAGTPWYEVEYEGECTWVDEADILFVETLH